MAAGCSGVAAAPSLLARRAVGRPFFPWRFRLSRATSTGKRGPTVIVFDVVFPSMGSDRRDYRQKVSKIAVKKKGKFLTFLALFALFIRGFTLKISGFEKFLPKKEVRPS